MDENVSKEGSDELDNDNDKRLPSYTSQVRQRTS